MFGTFSFVVLLARPTIIPHAEDLDAYSVCVDLPAPTGYTPDMKTAVSIPDDVFAKAERLARRVKKSRSRVFSEALREYLARHASDEVTEAMNRTVAALDGRTDPFVSTAARRALVRTEW